MIKLFNACVEFVCGVILLWPWFDFGEDEYDPYDPY